MPHRSILLLSCMAIVACGGDDGGPNKLGASGSVSFAFSGGISGNFSASGAVTSLIDSDFTHTWAGAVISQVTGQPTLTVQANLAKTSSTHDSFVLHVTRTTTGAATISPGCSTNCADFFVAFGESNTLKIPAEMSCSLATGMVVISSIANGRVSGTFSGSGACAPNNAPVVAITVTNGTFDVPLFTSVGL